MQGTAGGKEFARRWIHVSADHLAMLKPEEHGACSVADGCGAPRMFAAHQHHQQTEDKSMTPEEIHAAVQALRAEMAAERNGRAARNRILSEYAADAAYAVEVKPGPYDVALGREINADLDLDDVLLPSTGKPTAELPAPPSPYDEPIRQLRERDRMREAHR